MEEKKNQLAVLEEKTGIVFSGTMKDNYEVARMFIESGYFADIKSVSQGMVKVQAGKELGLEPFASMQGLYIVKGKIQISGNTIAGKIKSSPKYDYLVLNSDKITCEIAFFENVSGKKQQLGNFIFTIEDAKKANLLSNSVAWKNYPQTMLFNRAISGGYKMFCPDIFTFSVYTNADTIKEFENPNYNQNDVSEIVRSEIKNQISKKDIRVEILPNDEKSIPTPDKMNNEFIQEVEKEIVEDLPAPQYTKEEIEQKEKAFALMNAENSEKESL